MVEFSTFNRNIPVQLWADPPFKKKKEKTMLVPAITKKEELLQAYHLKYYTKEAMFESGWQGINEPNILNDDNGGTEQYAVVDKENKLIGYISFYFDTYAKVAQSFCMICFDEGNPIFGRDLYALLKRIIKDYKPHIMEWRMVSGNPVERHYDSFCKRYDGNKYILKDRFKDRWDNYHDNIIYEIIFEENRK